jgi:hypothetical protein
MPKESKMSEFKKGDLIYIPSVTIIFKWSDDENIPVGPTKTLKSPKRALFLKDVSDYYSQVIFDAERWTVKKTDIWELNSLPMIKGDQDLGSSRIMIKELKGE